MVWDGPIHKGTLQMLILIFAPPPPHFLFEIDYLKDLLTYKHHKKKKLLITIFCYKRLKDNLLLFP